jgi:hypothetical protein
VTLPQPLAADAVVVKDPAEWSLIVKPAQTSGHAALLWRQGLRALAEDASSDVWAYVGHDHRIARVHPRRMDSDSSGTMATLFTGRWPPATRLRAVVTLTVWPVGSCVSGSAASSRARSWSGRQRHPFRLFSSISCRYRESKVAKGTT